MIEESFVNRSKDVLEGVFYFPLPQDASISGFGMWIGDKLVEADVVEKERAREIYETILRERRDPGLLEWTGGNIFKARVYPIPAGSEKRIKISYTQVLPLQGNRYRYSYALQSELLKQHPLRDLKIDVKVNSAMALKNVASPTHPARIAKTNNSGHIEFTAQEHTPTKDFEALIEVEGRQSDVVVIPHRRGDDGYFMVQLTPPGSAGDWERPLIPNGEPLKLLLLADTSASMDAGQRAAQNAVFASIFAALTPRDTVNLAAFDVNTDWVFPKPVPATPVNLNSIQQMLVKRTSLGWTNLEAAFASVMKQVEPGTHVVYVGDGITTVGDADPVALSKRLQRLHDGKPGTFHSVAVGSSYEPIVMKTIASFGGGSMRRVTGERGPQAAAMDLLTEIATPTLSNLKVEFTGIRTARVYPEVLPNVPAGTQQILLGRYLPEGKDQVGEIVVTGMQGNKPVRFSSKISLKDAESGNSFIPRLWARMHLDKLLEQGTNDTVKQDVIALSEEFNIITPYTSLLVLETDADRERFGVKRRFQMRDGEKFFAEGRDNAIFELKQKQMRQAADFRTALRRQVLTQLATLGRDPSLFQGPAPRPHPTGGAGGGEFAFFTEANEFGEGFGALDREELQSVRDSGWEITGKGSFGGGGFGGHGLAGGFGGNTGFGGGFPEPTAPTGSADSPAAGIEGSDGLDPEGQFDVDIVEKNVADPFSPGERLDRLDDDLGFDIDGKERERFRLRARRDSLGHPGPEAKPTGPGYGWRSRSSQLLWVNSLFPRISAPPRERKEPKSTWPASALALSKSLLRGEKLAQHKGGLVFVRQSESFDTRWKELTSRTNRTELVSPTSWYTRTSGNGQVTAAWCDAKELGVYTTAFQLGRVRASNKLDLAMPLFLGDDSISPLHLTFAEYTASAESTDKDREQLTLKQKSSPDHETRYLIDTKRHVVVNIEQRYKGKVVATTKFEDFVEAAGMWFARRIEQLDEQGQRQSLTTQSVTELPADEFAKRMSQELAGKAKVLFLPSPLPKVADAKTAVAVGKATFDDRAVLTMHFAASQQWGRALEHFQEAERLAGNKPGIRWLRDAFLLASRRHEELRKRLLEESTALATTTDADMLANDGFLANHLVNQGRQILQTNEQLDLSDRLMKIYQRQPAYTQSMKDWRRQRVGLFQQAGQNEKALLQARELAQEYPRDYSLQTSYANLLASSGDYPAAYAWLDRVIVPEAKWLPWEEYQLRELFVNFLERQGRYRDMNEYLAAWLKQNPEDSHPYGQYLSALVRSNQAEKAETLAAQWLREAQVPGQLPGTVSAKLEAAVNFALGQGHNLHSNRVDERWHTPLAEAALFFTRDDAHLDTAGRIFRDWRFNATDAALAARKTLAGILQKELDKLSPEQINQFVAWVWENSGMERGNWQKVATDLRKRWDVEKKPEVRDALSTTLVRILSLLGPEEEVAFLRTRWKQADDQFRVQYANQLFNALLAQKWSAENEDEAFTMLDKLAPADEPLGGLFTRVGALHRLTDAMIEARVQASNKAIEHPENLPRTELRKKHEEHLKLAREGFAARLAKEATRATKPFANWITAERLWLDVLLERNFTQVADSAWEILSAPVAKVNPDEFPTVLEGRLDEALRDRLLTTLQNLAARKGADPDLVVRLLSYLDQQIKENPENNSHWREQKYSLLIAVDQVKELEATLRKWVVGPDPDSRWRVALGYLLAEQGQLPEAIKLFEVVEGADELTPREYRSLADWYLVENRREKHEQARFASYSTTEEYLLNQQLLRFLNPWQREGRLPTQLDPEIFQIFKVLFAKSNSPHNYLWQLQQFYQASRDFRLLAMLPDGVMGHTAGKVYPFLGAMRGVLEEVRDEATVDELVARIAKLRETAKTPIDLRALDMLELLVERRASELQNQPGPHVAKALAALEASFKREWTPGEPRLMADFLTGLGTISQVSLARDQLRQLESLHKDVAKGTFDRLHISLKNAETLNGYSRRPEAMDLLQAALKEFEEANGGVLPTSANPAIDVLIGYTEAARHFDRGEKLLLAQLTHPVHQEQKQWLTERMNELYLTALRNQGDVSLGNGPKLYKAVETKLLADVAGNNDQNHRYRLLSMFPRIYRTAFDLKYDGTVDDLRAFGFKKLPPVLKDQNVNYQQIVRDVAETVRDMAGPRDGVAFLLDRLDNEPHWLRYVGQDGWNQFSSRLAEWRFQAKDIGDLEPRLLKMVLAELRRDLRTRESHSRAMCDRQSQYFWTEKEAEFAKVAEEVYAERKQSSASVEHIASYLFGSLPREKRAIEILFAAHEAKILSEGGQWQLVDFLHRTQRFAESIAILLPLVDKRPESLGYRTKLMHAYHQSGKQAELLALLKDTDVYFHQKDRWNEGVMASLALSCLENKLFMQSVAYYKELIPLHQRTHPRRGIGNGVLSSYYSHAADAYAGLGKTKEAVDMASGAVVSWAPGQSQRSDSLAVLVRVLEAAPDLPGYVAELDQEKLQNAVIRKAIGQACRKNAYDKAHPPQLQLAAELRAERQRDQRALLTCFDKLGNKEGAIQQLLSSVELSRRDIKLFAELGKPSMKARTRNSWRRRAGIHLARRDAKPNESESHTMLKAELRQKQNRWQRRHRPLGARRESAASSRPGC
ncbi:MAG: VIT domain-containing protein [Gemmataceae bacterium]